MHHIRGKYDYQKHYLPPLRTSPTPQNPAAVRADARRRAERRREIEWGRRRRRELEEADELERAIEKRRWVYRHKLYAKVSSRLLVTPLVCCVSRATRLPAASDTFSLP